jgi:uncharacterized protein YcbK (DUF882 family)
MEINDLKNFIQRNLGNGFIQGNYLVFDNTAPLGFMVLTDFSLRELMTKNPKNSYTKLHLLVLIRLQAIRNAYGKRITISSSYRDEDYNKSKSKATASRHMMGDALDLDVDNHLAKELGEIALEVNAKGGVGLYPGFVHIDVGPARIWRG